MWPRPPRRDVVDWPAAVGTASRRLDTRRNAGGGGANRGRQRGRCKGQRPAQRGSNAVATTRATAIPSTRKTDAVSDMPGRRRRHGSSPGLMGHGAAKRDSTTSGRAQRQLLLLRLDTAVSPTQRSPRHRLCAVTAAAVTAEITELTPKDQLRKVYKDTRTDTWTRTPRRLSTGPSIPRSRSPVRACQSP